MRITAYFFGKPGSASDKACCGIFESRPGTKRLGAGIALGGRRAGERDVEYDVPELLADEVKQALLRAGFRLVPT